MTEKDFGEAHKKLVKYFTNGITHNLILWIISKEPIHGYGIMKKLDDFFSFDNGECDIKNTSSKIYPILSRMEENGLIDGEWKINENNKRVKYYSITDKGEELLNHIQFHMNNILTNKTWLYFIKDMTGLEIS